MPVRNEPPAARTLSIVDEIEIRPVRYGAPVARELVAAAMADLAVQNVIAVLSGQPPLTPV